MKGFPTLVVLVALAGCATSPPPVRTAQVESDEGKAFIEETAVDVPEHIDGATLINIVREAETAWGVDAFYRLEALPDARLDLFVYPAGRMPAAEGSRRGQASFVGELKQINDQRLGSFEILGQEPFAVPLDDGRLLGAFKTRMRIENEGRHRSSRAYIAWRHDHYVKLRLSAEVDDETAFDALADRSALQLLAQVQIRNVGNCLRITVHKVDVLPPGQPGLADRVSEDGAHIVVLDIGDEKALADALVVSAQRLQHSGCLASGVLPEPAAGYRRQVLRYKPGDWKPAQEPAR